MTSMKIRCLLLVLTCLCTKISISIALNGKILIDNNQFIQNQERVKNFNKCLLLLMRQNVPCNAFISFVYSESEISDITEFINKNECYSIILRTFSDKKWIIWNEFYVIVAIDSTELLTGLFEMRRDNLWNPGAKFIITIENVNTTTVEDMFQTFLKLKIYNVLLLNYSSDKTVIYTYYPFRNGKCGDSLDEVVYLGSCLDTKYVLNFTLKNDFQEARNCVLKTIKFPDSPRKRSMSKRNVTTPLAEEYVLNSYAESANFTVSYKLTRTERDFGVVYPNGSVTGLIGYLHNHTADIALGSTVIIMNRANLFDFTYGFNFATFNLYTSALGSEMWKKVYKEFDATTYLIIFLFYCLMVVVCVFFLQATPEIPHSRVYLIVKLWGFFYLGNGTEPFPKTKRLRSVILCWIWFTFLISSFYNSDMYSLITGHIQRVRQIEPNKLASIPYKPCIPDVMRTFFLYAYNEALPESFDPVACHSIDGALDTTANGFDLFTVQMKPSYIEREIDFIDEEGNRKLDAWNFGSDILLGFYIARGAPFKEKLQSHAQYMYETGLVENYKKHLSPPKGAIPRRKGMSRPFVLEDFRVHYGVLVVGVIISTITFIAEIVYYRKTNPGERPLLK